MAAHLVQPAQVALRPAADEQQGRSPGVAPLSRVELDPTAAEDVACYRRNGGERSSRAPNRGPSPTAARFAALAEPSQILVTGTVKDLVLGSGIGFAEHGTTTLKGVPGTWQLYAFTHA